MKVNNQKPDLLPPTPSSYKKRRRKGGLMRIVNFIANLISPFLPHFLWEERARERRVKKLSLLLQASSFCNKPLKTGNLLEKFAGKVAGILFFILLWLIQPVFAMETPSSEKAFQLQANYVNSNTVSLHFTIKPGNHLFKDHFSFSSTDSESVKINHTDLPKGQPIHDDIFGDYQVYQINQ